MTWDPSIILGAKQYTGPDPSETMHTLGQLATMRLQQQQAQMTWADMMHARQQQAAVEDAYRTHGNDPSGLSAALMGAGAGPQAFAAQDQGMQIQKAMTDLLQHTREHVGKLLYGTTDEADYQKRLSTVPEQQRSLYPSTWAEAKPIVDSIVIPPEKRAELAHKDAELQETKRWHEQVGGQKTVKDGTDQEFKYNPETGTFDIPVGKAKPPKPAGGGLGGEGGTGLTKESIEAYAQDVNRTGKMTQGLGVGKTGQAARNAILNRAAEIAGQQGGDISSNRGSYVADTTSLKKLQPVADNIESFEKTGLKNLDVAVDAFKKLPDAGSSLLNKPLRAAMDAFGSNDMAAAKTAFLTVQTEFGKILSGATGGVVSDSARHEAQELLRGDYTLGQFLAAADILKKDAANRSTAVHEQLADIKKRMGAGKNAAKPADGGAATVTVRRKADGKTKTLSADDAAQVLADPAYEKVP